MRETQTETISDPKAPWFEATSAILMAIATLATAWCSYQNSRWSGAANDLDTQADGFQRKALAMHLESRQLQSAHLQLLMNVVDAQLNGNEKVVRFYIERIPPELKSAWEKWTALKPFENPGAPPNPFAPAFYTPPLEKEIHDALADAEHTNAQAKVATKNAGGYLSNTVLLAMVLFFAGTAGRFDRRVVRRPALLFAIAVFLYAAVRMLMLPTI